MAYFKIGTNDYSSYTSGLKVKTTASYNAKTNANYDMVVDYINSKRTIEVEIIPIDSEVMARLLMDIKAFSVSLSFRNPETNKLETGVACIIPSNDVEYYTIQTAKVSYKKMKLTFTEL